MSSFNGVRMTASRGWPASSRHATSVYFSSERRKSMSSTGISRTVCPTDARTQRSGAGAVLRCRLAASCLQQRFGVECRLRGAQAFLQSRDCLCQALRFDGLDQIVEHALRERLHGVLIVGGDEHQMRATTDVTGCFDARHARHVHIEKTDVGVMRLELVDRLATVARLRDDFELGPGLREHALERVAQQRLVFGNQRSRALASSCGFLPRREFQLGAHAVRLDLGQRNCASPPNASCKRSRNVDKPVPSPLPCRLQPDASIADAHEATVVAQP